MEKIILNISGMHCASCAANIESALAKVSGVTGAKVNFALEKAYIEFDAKSLDVQDLIAVIEKSGYKAAVPDESLDKERQLRDKEVKNLKIRFVISIILSSILMFICMAPCIGLNAHKMNMGNMAFIQFLLASGVLVCGCQFFTRGFFVLIKARKANMDTLVAIGVGSAYIYSLVVSAAIWLGNKSFGMDNLYYEVAAFLLTFIMLGKYLEALTKRKTSQAIRNLMGLKPKTAIVAIGGVEREVLIEELNVGDVIIVKPGQRVPVDGRVVEGYSNVDESMITGESLAVRKQANDTVIGGTINKSGSFRFQATKVGRQTMLAQIIKLIENAQGSKAPVQDLADKIAGIFVPAVLAIALISFGVWFFIAGFGFAFSLTVFITVLIIACPCSLGLATPTAVMVGTGIAAEQGIIIKDAASLQVAQELNAVIFDKTGTLTVGRPKLTTVVTYINDEQEVLQIGASLENKSEHPLAEAILESARAKAVNLLEAQDFESIPGKGIRGKINNSTILLGNRRLMQDEKIDIVAAGADLDMLESQGRTVILLVKDRKLIGLLAVRDELKKFSYEAVERLKRMGKDVLMITGDNKRTALAIAGELGIEKVLAEVLPQDKVEEIKKLQSAGAKTAFVGDGINDAPALTQADLGIAIGSGTDVAIEAGDIILIKDDLRDVVTAINLSGYAMKKIKQNLFWAFFYNSIGIPVAAGILYPVTGSLLNPIIAALAMAFSSVSVVGNSLLMRRYKNKL